MLGYNWKSISLLRYSLEKKSKPPFAFLSIQVHLLPLLLDSVRLKLLSFVLAAGEYSFY